MLISCQFASSMEKANYKEEAVLNTGSGSGTAKL